MKIPPDAHISREKLVDYLLRHRPINDKAGFLLQVGFERAHPEALDLALRRLVATEPAVIDRVDEYGVFYRVEGGLAGPDGILQVVTIWMYVEAENTYRFITLKPARQSL